MIAVAPPHKSSLNSYLIYLEKLGLPYHFLTESDVVTDFSMLMLCGGADVGVNPERDKLEKNWFNEAYGKIPIIGICRGMQFANVCLGGTLYEDLPLLPIQHTPLVKENVKSSLHESSFHNVKLEDGRIIRVNSRHHQSVEKLAEGLKPMGYSEDNIVEMAEGNNSLFVQWHPEREDVWGTECEIMITNWIKNKFDN